MILRASVVVTMDGPPIENGAVAVIGNRIVDVGKFDDVKIGPANEVVDLGEQALLPGLINAHCHLDYTCLRGKISPQKTFADWIRAINAEKAKLISDDYVRSIVAGFAESLKFGTTSMVNFEAFPEIIGRTSPPIRTWWLAELIDVRGGKHASGIIDSALDALGEPAAEMREVGLAPHALYSASKTLYRLAQETSYERAFHLATHVAESREEMLMFRDAAGPLYDFVKEIGRDMSDCGDKTPLAHFVEDIDPREGWIVIHLNELDQSDFELLSRSEKFNVVHCPRSSAYFKHSVFHYQKLRELGLNICLGTDSLASNQDLSLFSEMREFQKREPGAVPKEIIELATINPARALGRQSQLGQIKPGFLADMIALPLERGRDVFETIVAFNKAVPWTMVDGHARGEV